MKRILSLVATIWLLATACGGRSSFPAALSVENRGGPVLLVVINGAAAATVDCDGATALAPGEHGVPDLPWSLSIKRRVDDVVLFAGQVTELPKWFVQIGDSSLGLGTTPVSGPAGPPCPTG